MSTTAKWVIRAALLLTLGFAGGAAAQSLDKLPGELQIPKGADSPGAVSFFHETHVNPEKPDCISCHPREFRILKTSRVRTTFSHEKFDKGRQCGRCHDGKQGFKIDENCENCHRG